MRYSDLCSLVSTSGKSVIGQLHSGNTCKDGLFQGKVSGYSIDLPTQLQTQQRAEWVTARTPFTRSCSETECKTQTDATWGDECHFSPLQCQIQFFYWAPKEVLFEEVTTLSLPSFHCGAEAVFISVYCATRSADAAHWATVTLAKDVGWAAAVGLTWKMELNGSCGDNGQ